MSEEEKEIQEQKSDELYAIYGKFAISFEQLCDEMRECILAILQQQGLQDHFVSEIILANSDAYSLQLKIRALHAHLFDDAEESQLINKLFSKVIKLIEVRNKVIHGTWHTGLVNSADGEPEARAFWKKHSIGKDGLNPDYRSYTYEDMIELCNESEKLRILMSRLSRRYGFGLNFKELVTMDGIENGEGISIAT